MVRLGWVAWAKLSFFAALCYYINLENLELHTLIWKQHDNPVVFFFPVFMCAVKFGTGISLCNYSLCSSIFLTSIRNLAPVLDSLVHMLQEEESVSF